MTFTDTHEPNNGSNLETRIKSGLERARADGFSVAYGAAPTSEEGSVDQTAFEEVVATLGRVSETDTPYTEMLISDPSKSDSLGRQFSYTEYRGEGTVIAYVVTEGKGSFNVLRNSTPRDKHVDVIDLHSGDVVMVDTSKRGGTPWDRGDLPWYGFQETDEDSMLAMRAIAPTGADGDSLEDAYLQEGAHHRHHAYDQWANVEAKIAKRFEKSSRRLGDTAIRQR